MPRGTYQRLVDAGQLTIALGLRVPPVGMLMNAISAKWGVPAVVSCDRFRLADLQDVNTGWEFVPRVTRWSEASEDIRAIRSQAQDGPLSLAPLSRALIKASLAVCRVRNDDQESARLIKRGTNNTGRDDMAHAMTLAACGLQPASLGAGAAAVLREGRLSVLQVRASRPSGMSPCRTSGERRRAVRPGQSRDRLHPVPQEDPRPEDRTGQAWLDRLEAFSERGGL